MSIDNVTSVSINNATLKVTGIRRDIHSSGQVAYELVNGACVLIHRNEIIVFSKVGIERTDIRSIRFNYKTN